MGPKAPGGGKARRPRSRVRARGDPKPALGLAIRPGGRLGEEFRRGDPVGGWRKGGDCPSRARA
jgi:hypothetical protein